MTKDLLRTLGESDPQHWTAELASMIRRHLHGDWGDVPDEDKRLNDNALGRGGRLFSAYTTSKGIKVWVLTEADRSATTALLPDDY